VQSDLQAYIGLSSVRRDRGSSRYAMPHDTLHAWTEGTSRGGRISAQLSDAKSSRKPINLPWNVPLSRLLRVVMTMWNWGKRWTEQLASSKHWSWA